MAIKKKKKKKRKIIRYSLLMFVIFLSIGSIYALKIYNDIKATADQMHDKNSWIGDGNQEQKIEDIKPISILLMGVDERKGDIGRADTLILLTLNPKKNSMNMLSIPRDTRTEIVGRNKLDKINHAYAFGKTKMTVATVQNFTGVPIDYYYKVNMEALSDIVDALGGIKVTNSLTWTDDGAYKAGYVYNKGEIHLNGPKTVGYVRMRHFDPKGDFGRQERQKQVINEIINKGASASSITKFDDILNVMGTHVQTNMSFNEMKEIQKNYGSSRNNVQSTVIQGKGTKIDGVYYFQVSDEERKKLTNQLKAQLEIL
ncbi:LCP family protein [Fictibacillus sp. 26RED30]|nr:LCP family protein [Fictibacillus sp. 26RED30]